MFAGATSMPARLGRQDDVGQRRATVGEDVGHRSLDGVEVDAEARGEIRLRVHVDAEDAEALFLERAGEVDRRRRLADAALLVRDRDHVRHRGITSKSIAGVATVPTRRRRGVTVMLPAAVGGRPSRLSTRSASCSPILWIC